MKKIKKIFLESLPRYRGKTISWKDSIGYEIKFQYNKIKGIVKIINYDGKYLWIKYLDYSPFKISTTGFSKCSLGELLEPINKEYQYKVGDIIKTKHSELQIIKRIKIKKKRGYKYKCLKCNNEDEINEYSLKKGVGCNVCCGSAQKVKKGTNDISTTHPQLIKYFINKEDTYKYSVGVNKKLKVKCPECGYEKNMKPFTIEHYGFSCPRCGDKITYPEKFIFNILEQLKVNFTYQYSPKWANSKRYDFYFELNNKKYIIEADGGFHYINNPISGQTVEEVVSIDNYKDKMATEHKIKVIRIDCRESDLLYIKKNILNSELYYLFDLSVINWYQVEKYALNNLVKNICDMWEFDKKTTTQISNETKLSQATVIKYLKKGNEIGWCKYDSKISNQARTIKMGKLNGKKVKCVENGLIFDSCAELARQSENIFGKKLNRGLINAVCLGKRNHHGGFTFKYI